MAEKSSPRRGRPPRFTLDDVLDVAERMPYERLTMTALAKELGLVTSALYRYVRDHDHLVALLTERIAGMLPLPDDSLPWERWLHATAMGVFDLVLAHPVIADVRSWVTLVPPEGRSMIQARDRVLGAAGIASEDAVTVHAAATNLAMSYASSLLELRDLRETLADPGGAAQAEQELRGALASAVRLLADGVRFRRTTRDAVDSSDEQETTRREDNR